MTLSLVGTFPASALNLGLEASTNGLQADITKLTADISGLTGAIDSQVAVQASFPPSSLGFAAAVTSALNVTTVTQALNPATWVTASGDANADLTTDLALVDAQIDIVELIVADLQAGLGAAGLYGWSYAGNASGFGSTLRDATTRGYGGVGPAETVSGLVIATNAFASWGSFSEGFETGDSAQANLGETTSQRRLTPIGGLTGGGWNKGARAQLAGLELFLDLLRGAKAGLEAQIQASLGVNLPDPTGLVDFGLTIDTDDALDNLVNVEVDLNAAIGGIQADIDATADLIADIDLQLSAGGLSFWSYSGRADGIGTALADELASGLPGTTTGATGACYGVAIVSKSPTAWADFGRIFKNA